MNMSIVVKPRKFVPMTLNDLTVIFYIKTFIRMLIVILYNIGIQLYLENRNYLNML